MLGKENREVEKKCYWEGNIYGLNFKLLTFSYVYG